MALKKRPKVTGCQTSSAKTYDPSKYEYQPSLSHPLLLLRTQRHLSSGRENS